MSPHGSDRSTRRGTRLRLPQALALGLLLTTLTGCSLEEALRLGMPEPVTNHGPRILLLWQGSWAAAFAVGIVVWGLIVWSVIFHRRSRHAQEIPPQTRYNVPIEVLYTVVPFIIISVLFYFTARDETKILQLPKNPDETVNIVGRQWNWSFNYLDHGVWEAGTPARPPVLYLPRGESVLFKLTSPDVIHAFWVPAFMFKMDVIPGRVNQFSLTPTKEGTFAGRCAELCGADHSRMLFTVKVVSPQEFDQRIAALRNEGQTGRLPEGIVPKRTAEAAQ